MLLTLKRRKTDGHLGHDTRHDGTETLVQAKGRLAGHNLLSSREEAEGLELDGLASATNDGHARADDRPTTEKAAGVDLRR